MTFVDGGASSPPLPPPPHLLEFSAKTLAANVQGSDFCSGKGISRRKNRTRARRTRRRARFLCERAATLSRSPGGSDVLGCEGNSLAPFVFGRTIHPRRFSKVASSGKDPQSRTSFLPSSRSVHCQRHEINTCGADGRLVRITALQDIFNPSILPPSQRACARTSPSCRRAGAGQSALDRAQDRLGQHGRRLAPVRNQALAHSLGRDGVHHAVRGHDDHVARFEPDRIYRRLHRASQNPSGSLPPSTAITSPLRRMSERHAASFVNSAMPVASRSGTCPP